ncbi:LD-carboxypeptidase [archaeon]|jgi:muramoyltetrapeptide carboxypeptidase|nr:LD-carboxypeptidase [archaeon]MBT6182445.1 LD-carboxypeptidase [archaeon]MBT6606346.1 LD-carboxypeptidase [archaeon]MBT7251485.1 LD-carboxypeptidase [archaeon]MBT7660719.1 LD-carboxypeptidase [archaeon]
MVRNNNFCFSDFKVALVAPSRGTDFVKLELAKKRLNSLGIADIVYRKDICERSLGYWSGDFKKRAEELNDFFRDDSIDIIWCLNGGYTCLELIPYLDFNLIRGSRKLFIGFSDITSIQYAMFYFSGLETIQFHMPGVSGWMNTVGEIKMFEKLLTFGGNSFKISDEQIYSQGSSSGILIGGCISLLCGTLGTGHELDTRGKILYLEDANVSPQRLYNDLCHLHLSGKFEKITGLVISKMANCGDYKPFLDLFLEKLNLLSIPIIKEFDAGHCDFKIPIVLGGECSIDSEKKNIFFGFSQNALGNRKPNFTKSL